MVISLKSTTVIKENWSARKVRLMHRLVNRDVATHGKKFGLAIFNFLALISKGHRSRHCFSLINVSFVHLSKKRERREPIIFRAIFSKKLDISKWDQNFSYFCLDYY